MVVKHKHYSWRHLTFENGVILYGSKTSGKVLNITTKFENGVILYGSKTICFKHIHNIKFENGVILYGSKTLIIRSMMRTGV